MAKQNNNSGLEHAINLMATKYVDNIISRLKSNTLQKADPEFVNIVTEITLLAYKQGIKDFLGDDKMIQAFELPYILDKARTNANMSPVNKDFKRLREELVKMTKPKEEME